MSKKDSTGVNQEDLKKALDTLEEIDTGLKKSEDETGVDDLAKALDDAEKDLETLIKSADGDEDDKGGDKDGKCPKCGGECKDGKCEKCGAECKDNGAKPKEMEKSEKEEVDLEDLLIKSSQEATEAFEGLQKSVTDKVDGVSSEVAELRKSVGSLLTINVKMARVMASLAKSVQDMGGRAVAPSGAKLGVGKEDEKKLEKSNSEIQDLLEKAVADEKIDVDALSRFASLKVNGLRDAELQVIGLK